MLHRSKSSKRIVFILNKYFLETIGTYLCLIEMLNSSENKCQSFKLNEQKKIDTLTCTCMNKIVTERTTPKIHPVFQESLTQFQSLTQIQQQRVYFNEHSGGVGISLRKLLLAYGFFNSLDKYVLRCYLLNIYPISSNNNQHIVLLWQLGNLFLIRCYLCLIYLFRLVQGISHVLKNIISENMYSLIHCCPTVSCNLLIT